MIDYQKIANAVSYYEKLGYKYIDVPWFISLDSLLITRPPNTRVFETFAGILVASGEQSFLEIRKQLKPGKYQCVTPCFRDEKIKDDLHLQYFMKNELIIVLKYEETGFPNQWIERMILDAKTFFEQFVHPRHIEIVKAPQIGALLNQDILIKGIEVGSYGYRKYDNFYWIYGTGCAEPRLTQAIESKHG